MCEAPGQPGPHGPGPADQPGPHGPGPADQPGLHGPGQPGPLDWRPELRTLAELDSTNRYLLEEAGRGAPAGLAVAADYQTAGRGRLGRSWEAPPGTSVMLSVLLRPVLAPEDLHLCSLLVALAALTTCREQAGVVATLKWPNDLVVDEHKLAGVLAEADPSLGGGRPGSTAVVVGIGLNVRWPGPPEAGGTCLADEVERAGARAAIPSVAELRAALLAEVGRRVPALEMPSGRAALTHELAAQCSTLGRAVRVILAGEMLEGRAEAITPAGHLVVQTADGRRRTVAAGDVVHLRPAAPAHPPEPDDPTRPSGPPRGAS